MFQYTCTIWTVNKVLVILSWKFPVCSGEERYVNLVNWTRFLKCNSLWRHQVSPNLNWLPGTVPGVKGAQCEIPKSGCTVSSDWSDTMLWVFTAMKITREEDSGIAPLSLHRILFGGFVVSNIYCSLRQQDIKSLVKEQEALLMKEPLPSFCNMAMFN